MKKSLIIGAAGFVGGYLARELKDAGHTVAVTKLPQETLSFPAVTFDLDITDPDAIGRVLKEFRPDNIFHLAAQSSVKLSWERPALTAQINVSGAINLFECVKSVCPQSKIVVVGSGEEYGEVDYSAAVSETVPPKPANVYALTKLCQEQLAQIYVRAYGLHAVCTRSFNHIGPGQSPVFVVADFCSQVAKIERGAPAVIRVGNLSARRDFTDVRDVVKAYVLLSECGKDGEIYNVGSGSAVEIREILRKILALAEADIRVETDKNKLRPVDVLKIEADTSKLNALGWNPVYPLETTLLDTLNYFRSLSK